jgi:hypothetical protein
LPTPEQRKWWLAGYNYARKQQQQKSDPFAADFDDMHALDNVTDEIDDDDAIEEEAQ